MVLWNEDKTPDQVQNFTIYKAKFSYYSAKFYEKLHSASYVIPAVILHKAEKEKPQEKYKKRASLDTVTLKGTFFKKYLLVIGMIDVNYTA